MKLLLTSAGLTNPILVQALRDMLPGPTNESIITIIPTAHNPEPGDKSWVLQKTGLFEALPKWLESKVYVGISAGSQVIGSDLYATVEAMERDGVFDDIDYDEIGPKGQSSSKTLGLVDFTFRPHLNSHDFPKIRLPYLEQVMQTLKTPMYALDNDSAIKVVDNQIEVVGGGEWHRFVAGGITS